MIWRFQQRDRAKVSEGRLPHVLRHLMVTEKSTMGTQEGHYTFAVDLRANKFEIKKAVEHFFKVDVQRVNTLVLKGKEKRFRGRVGQRSSMKKAIVFLKEGQTIDMEQGA